MGTAGVNPDLRRRFDPLRRQEIAGICQKFR